MKSVLKPALYDPSTLTSCAEGTLLGIQEIEVNGVVSEETATKSVELAGERALDACEGCIKKGCYLAKAPGSFRGEPITMLFSDAVTGSAIAEVPTLKEVKVTLAKKLDPRLVAAGDELIEKRTPKTVRELRQAS